jgi:hypothetical protein
MNKPSVPPAVDDSNVKRGPTEFEHAQARRMLAALDDAMASGDREYIAEAYEAIALKIERIRPRLAAIVAAGGGPVDANGQPLYTVCPRCGRLLLQFVHDRHGARISTGEPEPCVRCIERGIFDSVPVQP